MGAYYVFPISLLPTRVPYLLLATISPCCDLSVHLSLSHSLPSGQRLAVADYIEIPVLNLGVSGLELINTRSFLVLLLYD